VKLAATIKYKQTENSIRSSIDTHHTPVPCVGQCSTPLIHRQLAHTPGLCNGSCLSSWARAMTEGSHTWPMHPRSPKKVTVKEMKGIA